MTDTTPAAPAALADRTDARAILSPDPPPPATQTHEVVGARAGLRGVSLVKANHHTWLVFAWLDLDASLADAKLALGLLDHGPGGSYLGFVRGVVQGWEAWGFDCSAEDGDRECREHGRTEAMAAEAEPTP